MKLIGCFKRVIAIVCTAALLTCGVSALAVSPADVPSSAALSAENSVSESTLRSVLSKLTVTYSSDSQGWRLDTPYEDASDRNMSCGVYPYLFLDQYDSTVAINLGLTYVGGKKLDMKTVRIETEDNYYTFNCDDEFYGAYDKDSALWFDFEIFSMDDAPEWFDEWLSAKSVKATFIGKDGTTKTYTLTKDNLQGIKDVLNAYNTLLDSNITTAVSVLNDLSK